MKLDKATGVGTVFQRRYGTSTVLDYEVGEGGSVRRVERYHPHDSRTDDAIERPHCATVGDVSPHVFLYDPNGQSPRPYDAACSCCYLGFPHTVDKHDQSGGRS